MKESYKRAISNQFGIEDPKWWKIEGVTVQSITVKRLDKDSLTKVRRIEDVASGHGYIYTEYESGEYAHILIANKEDIIVRSELWNRDQGTHHQGESVLDAIQRHEVDPTQVEAVIEYSLSIGGQHSDEVSITVYKLPKGRSISEILADEVRQSERKVAQEIAEIDS